MKILLLGETGYLGSWLKASLDKYDVETIDTGKEYDFIINCIGKPDLEFCEEYPHTSLESNFQVVYNICEKHPKSQIIHFSSYYVYDGEGLCTEGSSVTDAYSYTRHKLASERVVLLGEGNYVFRLGKLFGYSVSPQNKLTEYIINNDTITLDRMVFNPTSLQQVSDVVKAVLSEEIPWGLYNLSNLGTTTHYDYGIYINNYLGKEKTITPTDILPRKFHNYGRFAMSVQKLNKFFKLRGWQGDLENYLWEVKESEQYRVYY